MVIMWRASDNSFLISCVKLPTLTQKSQNCIYSSGMSKKLPKPYLELYDSFKIYKFLFIYLFFIYCFLNYSQARDRFAVMDGWMAGSTEQLKIYRDHLRRDSSLFQLTPCISLWGAIRLDGTMTNGGYRRLNCSDLSQTTVATISDTVCMCQTDL